MKKHSGKNRLSKTEEQFQEGLRLFHSHPFFGRLDRYHYHGAIRTSGKGITLNRDTAVIVTNEGELIYNVKADYRPQQWAFAIAHAKLHRAFGHFDLEKVPGYEIGEPDGSIRKIPQFDPDLWNTACDIFVDKFLEDIHFGERMHTYDLTVIPAGRLNDELSIYYYLSEIEWAPRDHRFGTGSPGQRDMVGLENPIVYDSKSAPWKNRQYNVYAKEFADALSQTVSSVVSLAGGHAEKDTENKTNVQKAVAWFMDHFPLLGGMAAAFRIKEDTVLCQRHDISVAAVDPIEGEVFVNPACGYTVEEWIFVMAHEFLHVGLQHHTRSHGRNVYLWNIACDFVINDWLEEMQVGSMPPGLLLDNGLRGKSAEDVYDIIMTNVRQFKKTDTFRGYGKGDILGETEDLTGEKRGISLDDFFKNALMQGLEYQMGQGRGLIPAGLVQEIRALSMPPIRWDVKLANWFDENIVLKDKHRSYAHPSRRQASTPDIPRPRYVRMESDRMAATFGVVIDTSGSMSAEQIGKALGAIASYAAAKEVPAVRVVFCDAAPYDAGYLETEAIANRVKVKGRGGTRLQPAVDLLERAHDFPKDGPILLITDGWIEDRMQIHRKHAFLLPLGRHLPFVAKGEVFYFD